jgi:hypothetical protein
LYPLDFELRKPLWDIPQNSRKREEHISPNGKWCSFPKVPSLLQYVNSGNYYGRIKVGRKLIRESLRTSTWTTARLIKLWPLLFSNLKISVSRRTTRVVSRFLPFGVLAHASCKSIAFP